MILAVTPNTAEGFWKFKKFNLLQKDRVTSIAAPAVLAAVGLVLIFLGLPLGALLLLVGVLYLPLMIFAAWLSYRRLPKKNPEYLATGTRFEFGPDKVKVTSVSPVKAHCVSAEMGYAEFFCVHETKDAFYLFLNATSSLILPKSDVAEGEAGALSELLSEKLKPLKKYRRYGG